MFYDPTMPKHPAFCDLMKIYERKQKDVQDLTDHADFGFDKFVIWYDEQTDLKKFQDGHFGGKNSVNHHATVVGDTVGDPFKDTSGPSLNILIKLMSMVSIVMAGLTVMIQG